MLHKKVFGLFCDVFGYEYSKVDPSDTVNSRADAAMRRSFTEYILYFIFGLWDS